MAKKQDKIDYKKSYEDTLEQNEVLLNDLKRLQAEFENYKKRCDKENADFVKYANEKFITDILPVLDSFKLSLRGTPNLEDFKKGVELIYAQFISILEKQGLRIIDSVGTKFDPYKHEVLLVEESNKDDLILEELQKGYMLNDKIIRHSKVKIGKVKK